MSRRALPKSIFKRVKEIPPPRPLPVLVHGDKVSAVLHGACERVTNINNKRVKYSIEAIKMSAAHHGAFSLSANQIGISSAIFVIHKHMSENHWFDLETQKAIEDAVINEEGLPVLNETFVDTSEYDAFINPKVLKETTENVYDWEYCSSFPNIRCMVRRPTGVLVSYLDESGDE